MLLVGSQTCFETSRLHTRIFFLVALILLVCELAAGVHRVQKSFEEGPLPRMRSITGETIELPLARLPSEAAACVDDWRAMQKESPRRHFRNKYFPHSSLGEDLVIFDFLSMQAFEGMWSGGGQQVKTFIEMGAFDGVSMSNTLLYERCLNWTGVLIEANPSAFKALELSGRTHSDLVHATTTCNSSLGAGSEALMGTIMNTAATLVTNLASAQPAAKISCVSLAAVLEHLGTTRVDFFSLDVEGAEDLVLSTLDFRAADVALVMVESINRQCPHKGCPKRDGT